MNRADVARLARDLMDAHGLHDWDFAFDRGRRRAGACHHSRRAITLSAALTSQYDEATVRDVVLHEIAHALVGAAHGHDEVWRAMARRIGAKDRARLDRNLPAVEAPWVGTCRRCGNTKRLYRSPQRVVACGVCSRNFSADLILQWTFRGEPRQPGRAYQRELAQLRRAGLA